MAVSNNDRNKAGKSNDRRNIWLLIITTLLIIGSIIIRTIVTFVYYFGIAAEATMAFKAMIIAVIMEIGARTNIRSII